jgi:hypothetical protein
LPKDVYGEDTRQFSFSPEISCSLEIFLACLEIAFRKQNVYDTENIKYVERGKTALILPAQD